MQLPAIVLIALLVVIPGCLNNTPPADDSNNEALPELDVGASFNECRMRWLFFAYPPGQNPAEIPDGWGREIGITQSALWVVECERARIGPYERPLQWLLELHNVGVEPSRCQESTEGAIVLGHWTATNDPEVSAWLTNDTGVNFHVANADFGMPEEPGTRDFTVTSSGRHLIAGTASTRDDPSARSDQQESIFFANQQGGLTQFIWLNEMHDQAGTTQIITGNAEAPLLASSLPQPFIATTNELGDGGASWETLIHENLDCS